jgi:hypothetical protein
MDYELVKEMHDAGFPQGGRGTWTVDPTSIVARSRDRVYVPTLEELIDACGDISISLGTYSEGVYPEAKKCFAMHGDYQGIGMTLKIAVARLWLALQKVNVPRGSD